MSTQTYRVGPLGNRIDGTHLVGYLQPTTYAELVELLGEPTYGPEHSGDGKVQAEWQLLLRVDGRELVATIYDWKSYDTPVEDITEWHVGGAYDDTFTYVDDIMFCNADWTRETD